MHSSRLCSPTSTHTCIHLIPHSPNSYILILAGSIFPGCILTVWQDFNEPCHIFELLFPMCFLCGIYEINNFAFYACLIFYIVGASPATHSSLVVSSSHNRIRTHPGVLMCLNLSPGMSCPALAWMVCLCVECIDVTMRQLSSLCLSPPFGCEPLLPRSTDLCQDLPSFCQQYPLTVSLERGH